MTWEEKENFSLREDELDEVGNIFGMRYVNGGAPNGLIEIYIEDDELWHRKVTVNHVFLGDLIQVASNMRKRV